MPAQAFGRWNRAHPATHSIEIIHDGPTAWPECRTCNWQGDPGTPAQADVQAEQHERDVFDLARAGGRQVRGRVEY